MNMVDPTTIFGPVLGLICWTLVIWVWLYVRRIPFIQSLDIEPNDITGGKLAALAPPEVSNPSDNFKNLFEVPVLFYALAVYLFVTQNVASADVALAWAFFALRVLHSLVHCTVNIVLLRFWIYALSTLCVFALAVRAVIAYLG